MSINRMLDYGMAREQAERAHREVISGPPWDVCLELIADEALDRAQTAEASGQWAVAAEHFRAAAASLIFAQMAFNFDVDRKRTLYRRMTDCFVEHARLARLSIEKFEAPYRGGRLFGWLCRASQQASSPIVIVFGGMSGWATAYLSMAEALCDAGLSCMLVDGPGQGESRLESGLFLDADVAAGFSCFVDLASEASVGAPIGIWGNSFGGLFAALTAVADTRISACCVNGAPLQCEIPPFRTAAEQMAAMFGKPNLNDLDAVMQALSFDRARSPVAVPTLIVEGGADPLVPLGTQSAFREGNEHPLSRTMTWPDGEHTIYNHASERNAMVSQWFAESLSL
jgi:alpha-beta hydrolase superfamily lysophospholipase